MKNQEHIEECLLSGTFMYEEPLICSCNAAMVFGLEGAMIAQKFVYWTLSRRCKLVGEMSDGRKWVFFSLVELCEEFPWTSAATIRRRVNELVKCGFLSCRKSTNPADMRNRFTVNHGTVAAIESGKLNCLNEHGNLAFRLAADGDFEPVEEPAQSDWRPAQSEHGSLLNLSKSHKKPMYLTNSKIAKRGKLPGKDPVSEPFFPGQFQDPETVETKGQSETLKASPSLSAEPTPQTPVPQPPLPQGRPETLKPSKVTIRPRNALLDALAVAGGLSIEHMAPAEWGKVSKALKGIRSVKPDLTPGDLSIAAQNYRKLYGENWQITPLAIESNWSKIHPGAVIADKNTQQPQEPWKRRNYLVSKLDRLEETYLRHPANPNSRRYDPDAAAEVVAEGAAKKLEIKSIKQQIAELPPQL